MKLVHFARRFFVSLRPGGPSPVDEAWARAQLSPGEVALWSQLSGSDRRHAVGVARAVPTEAAPAALLHDVGKIVSGYGTFRRVLATVLGLAGRDRWGGRVGQYLRHPELGADLLREAGSDQLTSTWAAEHHLPPECWTVPPHLGAALEAADND